MKWHIIFHSKAVDELNDLPFDMRAKLTRILEIIEQVGPFQLKEPHIKSLGHKLMEIRLTGKCGISRVIYITLAEGKVALLHAFIKKTQKTPQAALTCALKRSREIANE